MARPTTIDDRQLLRAARELFLERGVSVTTAEIAKRAGIAQGSIFRRYRSKVELFRAAMTVEGFPWMIDLRERTERHGLKAALIETGPAIIELYQKVLPAMMMSWSSRKTAGPTRAMQLPPPMIQGVFNFFTEQIEAGRVRKADPRALAVAFISPLMTYALIRLMGRKSLVTPEEHVAAHVELLWGGIAPERRHT